MSSDIVKPASRSNYEIGLGEWVKLEKAAIELIHILGTLWYDRSVELIIFRNQIVDRSASQILALHQYAREFVKKEITVIDSLAIAREISELDLAPSRIDIGKLTSEWITAKESQNVKASDFVADKLEDFIGREKRVMVPKDVVLFGFGRIGRILARELVVQAGRGEQLRLRAIVTRSNSEQDITKRADLLRTDSIHGPFPGTVIVDLEKKALVINGHCVYMIAAGNPEDVDYSKYGINDALLIDNTGVFRDREGLNRHMNSPAISKVLLTAPGAGDLPNVVYGINHDKHNDDENLFSAASCTTNAIVPILSVIDKTLGIKRGHIETIHSYTNDQNLLDNYHKKYRRGRSAALNMVITETGADKAVSKALPQLAGKITGNSVRVPTPNVSLAILNLTVEKETSKEEVNEYLRDEALNGELIEQIQYLTSNETVSSDLVGNSCTSIVDSPATIVSADHKNLVLYVWYDNEYGYSRQVIRFAKYLAKVIRLTYY
jgi:glyceraldehyde 3-phosphate dehydrogenase (phosphorylating)